MGICSEKLISVRSEIAQDLEEICSECECDMNTVLTDLMNAMGGKDGAIIKIYHAHHAAQDDDELPDPLFHSEQEVLMDEED